MYPLFELSKLVTLSESGSSNKTEILLCAYSEYGERNIIALLCNNGRLLFYYLSASSAKPIIRQLQWFHHACKTVRALCFDPTGSWLLLVSADATLYIFPVLLYMDPSAKVEQIGKASDLTEIRLSGQRAIPTSLKWWHTLDGQHIAIIGNELGEINFVNLKSRKEVGGTYVTVGIRSLQLILDDMLDITYLLITGSNKTQWCLFLEEKRSNLPHLTDTGYRRNDDDTGLRAWCSPLEHVSDEESYLDCRPRRISKFDGSEFMTPQYAKGHYLVSAYNATDNILQVFHGNLEYTPLFTYNLPVSCDNVVLCDKFLFLASKPLSQEPFTQKLVILSCHVSDSSSESSKKQAEAPQPELQSFELDEKIIAIFKRSPSFYRALKRQNQVTGRKSLAMNCQDTPKGLSIQHKNSRDPCYSKSDSHRSEKSSKSPKDSFKKRKLSNEEIASGTESILEGCIVVTTHAVYECRQRVPPEQLFLSLTNTASDLPQAERLGIMLGLDIHRLYEISAETQLSEGHFSQAVRLYQLAKSPQLKRVAHFVSYGYLSELIAYIQVLFSTKGMEIAHPDKGHFANIVLHCFVQQILEKRLERSSLIQAFRLFLRDNLYYDEEVAVRLLAEQGLYDLLLYCAKLRGQHQLMMEHLLTKQAFSETIDSGAASAISGSQFTDVLDHSKEENYILCITSPDILQYLASRPRLLWLHLQRLLQLLPRLDDHALLCIAQQFDLLQPATKLVMRKVMSQRHRYLSISSLNSVSSDNTDSDIKEEEITEDDVIKFFLFVLLMLNRRRETDKFNIDLLSTSISYGNLSDTNRDQDLQDDPAREMEHSHQKLTTSPYYIPLACGAAHAACIRNGTLYTWGKAFFGRLGNGESTQEFLPPAPVSLFTSLRVNVTAVACGAYHTLTITDCGVFGWGLSRYGQLGTGDMQRSSHPVLLESLAQESVVAIACGQYHSLAATSDGRVFTWGWGVHGQLGHGDPEDCNLPKQVLSLKNEHIVGVAGGHGHSVVLTKGGDVYTFGCGMFGQLGIGIMNKRTLPQYVSLPEPIHLMSSNYFHTVVVTTSNRVFIWGSNPQSLRLQAQTARRARVQAAAMNPQEPSGQRSHASSPIVLSQSHLTPAMVDTSTVAGLIVKVATGSHHSVILTSDGDVYSWGRSTEGQLGHGNRKEQKVPGLVLSLNDQKVSHVACGTDFTIAMDKYGKLWGWGQNDYGQLGLKVKHEKSIQQAPGSSAGRIITIRTNRRMITITQGCRQGEMKPVEIPSVPAPSGWNSSIMDFDSYSYDTDSFCQMMHPISMKGLPVTSLSTLSGLDDPSYGPRALHMTLKLFYQFLDTSSVLKHCLSFGNFQAAAKLCCLEGLYAQAIEYQLKALSMLPKSSQETLTYAKQVVEFYIRLLTPGNTDTAKQLLEHIIDYWISQNFPTNILESIFRHYLSLIGYPLGLLLFCSGTPESETTASLKKEFVSSLSTEFCIAITSFVIEHLDAGRPHPELVDQMVQMTGLAPLLKKIHAVEGVVAGWEGMLPAERLWQEVLHNIQKGVLSHSNIHLSNSDVEFLAEALNKEKLEYSLQHPAKHESCSSSTAVDERANNDVVLFTCGHHYPLKTFENSVLPAFADAMQRFSCSLPQTTTALLTGYQRLGMIPTACPRCVMHEIKSEW